MKLKEKDQQEEKEMKENVTYILQLNRPCGLYKQTEGDQELLENGENGNDKRRNLVREKNKERK